MHAHMEEAQAEPKFFHVTHKEFFQFLIFIHHLVSQNINTISRLSTPPLTLTVYQFPPCLSKSPSIPFSALTM